jgi:hypothetical protein
MQLQSGQRLLGAIENMANFSQFAVARTQELVDTQQIREAPADSGTAVGSFSSSSSALPLATTASELSRDDMIAALQARLKQHQTDRNYAEEQMHATAALIGSGAASSSQPSVPQIPVDLPTDRDFSDFQDPRLVGITPSVSAPFGNQRPEQHFANIQAMAAAELEPQTRILSQSNDRPRDPRRYA